MTDVQEKLLEAYFAGQICDKDSEALLALLREDVGFAAEFREAQKAYVAACMPAFEKTKEQDFSKLRESMRASRVRRRAVPFWKYASLAASLVAGVFIAATVYTQHRYAEAEHFLSSAEVMTVAANNGTGTETVLPDGTHVRLNAGSLLTLDRGFGREGRDVTLQGEGFFEVSSDAKKPFRVHSGNACVTVKGTVFNVRNYDDEDSMTVSLLEGCVALSTEQAQAVLAPGECAVVSREDASISLCAADPSVSAWIKGKIVFTDKTVPEILRRVERNYNVHFTYNEALFSGERFTGQISSSLSIDEILSYIDVDDKYSWTRNDDTITIFRKHSLR